MFCLTRGRLVLSAGMVCAMALVGAHAAPAQTICQTNLAGTTICNDRTITRANLSGTRFDNTGMVWRRTHFGFDLRSDGTARRAGGGAAAQLRDADGRLWGRDPFPAATGAIGGVGCDTARLTSSYCF